MAIKKKFYDYHYNKLVIEFDEKIRRLCIKLIIEKDNLIIGQHFNLWVKEKALAELIVDKHKLVEELNNGNS